MNGLRGDIPALVGYNAGDGIVSYTVPESLTYDILRIASTSNVDVPGMWVFRLDEEDVVLPTCDNNPIGKYLKCARNIHQNNIIVPMVEVSYIILNLNLGTTTE